MTKYGLAPLGPGNRIGEERPMKRRVIGLGEGGKLVIKLPGGREQPCEIPTSIPGHVYLLVDCSGSMAGQKLVDAAAGADEFARSALAKGYRAGLIRFDSDATLVCEAQEGLSRLTEALSRLSTTGSTNMAAGIDLATNQLSEHTGTRAIVLVTDGQPDDPEAALAAARSASACQIQIITIGTDDADAAFLRSLATADHLAVMVDKPELRTGIASAARLLRAAPERR